MGGECPKNYPQIVLKGKHLSQFNESLIRNYDENSDIGYFLKVDIDYP